MATYYIATTGNDTTGNGSSGNPWLTVSKFISSSVANDTLIINDGTYNHGTGVYNVSDRTIQAANNLQVFFNGGNNGAYSWSGGGTIAITGINFYNYDTNNDTEARFGSSNVTGGGTAGDWTFTNCKFYDCILDDDAPNYGGLFGVKDIDNSTQTFDNCLVYNISQDGGGAGRGGLFKGNRTLGVTINNSTIIFNSSSNHLAYLFYPRFSALYTVNISNTIIANYTGSTVTISNVSLASQTNQYSCFYNMTNGSGSSSGTGVITSDPLLIDVANNNFNLRPTSPCIDAGVII